ncbi:MAG: mechanosensitive ion channel family protein [Bacilli bacterium]|nr:mechanosensitive ion channel family protein [Bacilli bacterium]
MEIFDKFCRHLSKITTINEKIISVVLLTIITLIFFAIVKRIITWCIKRKMTGRGEYVVNHSLNVLVSAFEVICLIAIFSEYIQSMMTLISVVSAAITIALREVIVNFFCGIYIKTKKPFKVEDRIQVNDIKGDVMNTSILSFEILEVSTKEENGQSTGVVVTFPNSIIFTTPVKNINKGFKYIWDELIVKVELDSDLVKNKQEIYKIVNNLDDIKSIPRKMKNQIADVNTTNRVYFNQFDPMIYTRIVDNHVELTVRYLIHPKKARYVESVIWNKIYLAYKDEKINLYTGA